MGLALVSEVHRCYEVGYIFVPDFHGRGFAMGATRAMIDVAPTTFETHRVIARLDAESDASRRVRERLGLRREGHLVRKEFIKGERPMSRWIYAVLDEEWALLSD